MNDKAEVRSGKTNPESAENILRASRDDVFNLVKNAGMAKQMLEESKMQSESETRKILLGFLAIADSFKSRLDEFELKKKGLSDETVTWISKFNITYKKLLNTIKEYGITQIIITPGEIYNSELHNAVEVEENPDLKDGTILQEIYPGYYWRAKVLRPTDVRISRSKK
jgi:molecular chaperone GrpE